MRIASLALQEKAARARVYGASRARAKVLMSLS
jgi:hypothetical protein